MKRKIITAVDMYCGAGGTDEGLRQTCERQGIVLKLIAVNHWEIAIARWRWWWTVTAESTAGAGKGQG